MYVHAYQSYVWNAVVSERITTYGAEKPVPGDLVFDTETTSKNRVDGDWLPTDGASDESDNDAGTSFLSSCRRILKTAVTDDASPTISRRGHRRAWEPPRVKTLTAEDLDNYSIFDVIMPLPGIDVAFPGGSLGERYKEFLRADGLDPNNFVRKQKYVEINIAWPN
jgi:tRNA pseudouridine13 synthase